MRDVLDETQAGTNRRSFLKKGIVTAAGAGATVGAGLLADIPPAQAGGLTVGDAAILRFLSALEQIERDLWLQYAELGGVQTTPSELPGLPTGGSPAYTAALNNLDGDMAQYIHDNTEDEFSHHAFINSFLAARGAATVDLSPFATLQGSQATGANKTNAGSRTSWNSQWTPVFGPGIAAARGTPTSIPTSCFPKRSRPCLMGSFQRSLEPMPTSRLRTISKP